MKLLKLSTDGFGSLRGERAFDPERLTLMVDDNERGKSTLLAAIAAALYGLSDDKRSHRPITPLERWRPWDGGPFTVELELECAGERYTVSRDFQNGVVLVNPTSSMKTVKLEPGLRRLAGNQDPAVNNGSAVGQVTLGPKDGIVLLRQLAVQEPSR